MVQSTEAKNEKLRYWQVLQGTRIDEQAQKAVLVRNPLYRQRHHGANRSGQAHLPTPSFPKELVKHIEVGAPKLKLTAKVGQDDKIKQLWAFRVVRM
ncbi:MAG TPA: hypothetical protein VEI05_00750 [Burkholderiaceae bacterium]|nr:hypothetical protein [Burkholderiaceae bacterium]